MHVKSWISLGAMLVAVGVMAACVPAQAGLPVTATPSAPDTPTPPLPTVVPATVAQPAPTATSAPSVTPTASGAPASASPQPAATVTARRIVFEAGADTAVVQGHVAAFGMDRWVLRAEAGQTLSARLSFSTGRAILIIFGADGDVLISDHAETPTFTGRLPSTQDYNIDVRGNPDGPTDYTLTVTVR